MATPIHLVTAVGGYVEILPFLLQHYRKLGVESFFVNAHLSSEDDPVLEEIRAVTTRFGCGIASITVGDWQSVQRELYERQRRIYPTDWFILADQDELALWPAGVRETIDDCESQGYDFIRGCIVDRIARDGRFPVLIEDQPVEQQFPLGAFFSNPALTAEPRQVVAVRGDIPLLKGQHHALRGRACPAREHYLEVHHFKWHSKVYQRLVARAQRFREQGHGEWVESARFAEYYRLTNGQINLEDPNFMIGECTPGYEHFERVKKIVLNAPVPTA